MIKLVFPSTMLSELEAEFRKDSRESFGLILARPVQTAGNGWRLLVHSIKIPSADEYEARSETQARPSAAFRLIWEKRARQEGLSLIYCHSHPQERGIPQFSEVDDATEGPLSRYAAERVPDVPHLALLVGTDGCAARELGGGNQVEVWEIGRRVIRHFPSELSVIAVTHDRQVRAFGGDGQRAIQALRVAIVGLGGTGSVVAQQLAHLGVWRYLLIDADTLDESNLNRVVGALPSDIGKPKVAVAAKMMRGLVKGSQISAIQGDVLNPEIGNMLTNVDFIFCCTDSHGSRFFINQLVYQYFIPCIDMGVVIVAQEEKVFHFGGRVQMLAPGLGCLVCGEGILSPDHVRWDLSNDRQRRADPYFARAVGIKQPSVISLNSQAAGQGVTMFLAAVAGIPMEIRSQAIRGMQGAVRALEDVPRENCVNCSLQGFFGKGRLCDLPSRAI
jgi:hypothetical protein